MRNEPYPMYVIQYVLAGTVSMTSVVVAPDVADAIRLIELSLQDDALPAAEFFAVHAHSVRVIDPLRSAIVFTAAI